MGRLSKIKSQLIEQANKRLLGENIEELLTQVCEKYSTLTRDQYNEWERSEQAKLSSGYQYEIDLVCDKGLDVNDVTSTSGQHKEIEIDIMKKFLAFTPTV